MDNWAEEFQKKNGRKPTFAEFQAHSAEQNSSSTGAAPSQQAQPLNSFEDMQSNNVEGSQQQQASPQNATMMQQNVFQSTQAPAPKKPSESGAKVKRFFRSPLGITAIAVVVLLVGFVAVGLLTSTSRNSLRNKYNAAVKNKDTKALLALFPKEQTESRFADIGAKELIKSERTFEDFEKASAEKDFSITESKHLLFFKNYSLNATTTLIGKGDTPKNSKLTIGGRVVNDKDLKTAFFPGSYEIKAEVKSDFGEAEFVTELRAGKGETTSLSFDIGDSYMTLPAGPDSIKVSYDGEETDMSLSDETQKLGPLSRQDSERRDPKELVALNGEYGGVRITNAPLNELLRGGWSFRMEGKGLLNFERENVAYDKKKLDPYVKAFASDWFKAGQKGSTDNLDTLNDLISGTKTKTSFKDRNSIKKAYKGVEIDKDTAYSFYVGRDKSLYIVAKFDIVYTKTDIRKKGAKPETSTAYTQIVFRLDKDGKMKAVADYSAIRYGD